MSDLLIEEDGKTTIFTINRPHIKNAMNAEVIRTFATKLKEFEASDQRVAIITGAGKHFSGGADVSDPPPTLWQGFPTLGVRSEKPIIAAVNGDCVGGALALNIMCDLTIASENARFHYPEAKFGLTGGIAAALAGRIPHKFAMEVLLLRRPVSAQRAYEMGMVNQVVPKGEALKAALAIAKEMEDMAPLVLKTLKRFVGETLPVSPSEKMARVARELEIIRNSSDRTTGIAAFLADTVPVFEGK